jgi:hypothetical protein
MKRSLSGSVFLALVILVILIPAASAVSITESPDVVQPGQQITLSVSDLPDAASFSLNIGGKFAVTPGQQFSFETDQFNMPFDLNQGTVSATTHGTKVTAFAVKKGDATVQVGNSADANGDFTISKAYEISSGVYDYMTLSGKARTDTSVITSNMNLLGTKKGPASSTITFTVNGIDNGEVYITALVNGQQVLFKKVVVGNGIATATPTPTPTPTAADTTVEPTDTTVTTETTVPAIAVEATTGTTYTAAPTTSLPVTTTAAAAVPSVFTSADNQVSLTAQGVDYASLLMVTQVNPPEKWLMVGNAYSIAPDSLVFTQPATISFTVPASASGYACFIASLQNDQWVVVPSRAGTTSIDASINHVGTYALMAYKPESTLPATPAAAGQATTAAADTPVTLTGTPRVASIAQEQPSASATRSSPLDSLPVLGALAICTLAVTVLRKQE